MSPFRVNVIDMTGVERKLVKVVGPHTSARVAVIPEADVRAAQQSANAKARDKRYIEFFFEDFAATHAHVGQGRYEASAPLPAGRFLLVVTAPGKSPVLQRITVKQVGDVQRVAAGWDNVSANDIRNGQLMTVQISSAAPAKRANPGSRESVVTVKLFPRGEYVFMSGTYALLERNGVKDGTRFESFAEGRRNRDWASGEYRDGDIITILSCDDRARRTFAKSHKSSEKDWVLIDEVRDSDRRQQFDPVDRDVDLGILDFYAYLNVIGSKHAGSVDEASIFSHAFEGGPVLWNTDAGNQAQLDAATGRFKDDLDGRAKDWSQPLMRLFPDLRSAFAAKALLRIWGCNATILFQRMSAAPSNDTQYYEIDVRRKTSRKRERLTGLHTLQSFRKAVEKTYASPAAKFLGRPVLAAPPGMGSLFGTDGRGNSVMFITRNPNVVDPAAPDLPAKNAVEAGQDTLTRRAFTFLNRSIGPMRTLAVATGYFDFQELNARVDANLTNLPGPPYANDRFLLVEDTDPEDSKAELTVASGTQIISSGPPRLPAFVPPVAQAPGLTPTGRPGRLFVATNARISEIKRGNRISELTLVASPGEDCGILVENDGALFVLTRPNGGAFALDRRSLPVTRDGRPQPPVTNGFIERIKATFIRR